MPDTYTATDPKTGRTITFEWNASTPPTDADMEEVFAAAGPMAPAQHPHARVADAIFSKEFGKNLLRSGANALESIGHMGQAAVGQGPIPAAIAQSFQRGGATGPIKDIAQGLADRYGSADDIRNTMFTDPVGAAVDAFGLVGGGANVAGKVAAKAGNLGKQSGTGLMRAALKVPEKVVATSPYMPDDLSLAETALKQGINRSTRGRQKLDRLIVPEAQKKGALLDASQQTFNPHSNVNFPSTTKQIAQTRFENSVDAAAPKQAQGVLDDFQAGDKYNRPTTFFDQRLPPTMEGAIAPDDLRVVNIRQGVTPDTAAPIQFASQDKTRIGEGLSRNAWSKNPADQMPAATVDTQKALYGDLKAIEEQVSGVAAANARLQPLYALREYLVNTIGAPGINMPYPSSGGVTHAVGGAILPFAESVGARAVYGTGNALENAGKAAQAATPGAPAAGLNALQQAIMRVNRERHQR